MNANQSNAGVVPCMIVLEVLKEHNYERWCIFMQHYLVGQDLWDVVLSSEIAYANEEDPREWIKRNALALHAIKISCGEEKFNRIKEMNSAKDAWNALANLHKQENEEGTKIQELIKTSTVERKQASPLLKDIRKMGNSDAVKTLFETHPLYSPALMENGSTALRVAITAGKIELAKELISMISEGQLEMQDKSGKTVLSLAAFKGSREIIECLVAKNKKLLEIPDCKKKIPLVLACVARHKSLTLYLYSVTPIEILDPVNGDHGFFLLKECIRNHMFGRWLLYVPKYSHTYARAYARDMVHFTCEQLSTLGRERLKSSGAVEASFKAIQLGYLDFVKEISEANPEIVWSHSTDPDEHSRDMLMHAVAHRQGDIAEFLYRLDPLRIMEEFNIDDQKNNLLHLAAKLPPSCPCIQDISDPLLRMQSEANWFRVILETFI
ncbi:hypothetical protein SLEP1_g42682 [Rubroshorea leprosula]|uniref:DUF4219 domain-containing protein n=1 Tax=Rubroshorea leprosula TaxID=152421 RepID=A0AAV5LB71_9ROSI|nr:hypothetical protein SLEP1_g42682 [Rubroshorea leprosula]